MRAPVKQQLAMWTAAALTWAAVVGCDDTLGNDKQVRHAIAAAQESAAKGDDAGLADAHQKLTEAAGNTGASPAASAQAKASLAAAEVAEASRLMQVVDANSRDIARLVYEISLLGGQIANSNLKSDRYRGLEPSAAREQTKKAIAEIQGGGEKATWITAENASVPTLAAVKQDISRLQGEIAKRQQQIKEFEQKRVAAATEADKNREAAEQAKGDKRVELVKAAAAKAREASDLATQIEVVQAQIIPFERDLAVAQSHQAAATAAVASLQRQLEAMDNGWKAINQQLATQAQIAQNVLGAAGAAPPPATEDGPAITNTINEKAVQLNELVTQTKGTFDKADTSLDNAITNYGAAVTAANALAGEVQKKREGVERNSPYYKIFDELMLTVNPNVYKLGQAEANQLRGTINASQAISLLGQQRMIETLQPILAAAKLEMPQSINAEAVPAELARTMEKANATYDEAAKLFLEVTEAPQEISAKNAARIGRIFALYGKVMLARATQKPDEAAQFLAEAKEAQKVALENKAALPAMPVELIVMPAPTTAPTTGPTTAPGGATTAPADGAAPTDPGATPPAEGTTPAPAPPVEGGAPAPAPAPADGATPAPATPSPDTPVEPATPAAPAPDAAPAPADPPPQP